MIAITMPLSSINEKTNGYVKTVLTLVGMNKCPMSMVLNSALNAKLLFPFWKMESNVITVVGVGTILKTVYFTI